MYNLGGDLESEPPVDQSEVRLEVNDSASVEVEQKDTESSEPQWTAFDNQNEVSSSKNWANFSKPTSSKDVKSDNVSDKVRGNNSS